MDITMIVHPDPSEMRTTICPKLAIQYWSDTRALQYLFSIGKGVFLLSFLSHNSKVLLSYL